MRISTDSATERIDAGPLTDSIASAKRSVGTAAWSSTPPSLTAKASCGAAPGPAIAVGSACVTGLRGRQVGHARVDRLVQLRRDARRPRGRRPPVRLVAGHLLVVALRVPLRHALRVGR